MRNTLAVLMTVCIGGALLGCSSKSNTHAPTSTPPVKKPDPIVEPRLNPGWALKIQSKCSESVGMDQCVGFYGFTVFTDGHYQVGPGPEGQIRTGTLTADELAKINTALTPALTTSLLDTEGHEARETKEVDDVVTLVAGANQLETLVRAVGTDFNYQVRSANEAKTILSAIRDLAVKYYALPFPEPCGDGANTLTALYTAMQSCATDSDCAYLDSSLDTVTAETSQALTTDDCTLVRPLVVGNSALVKSNKDKLLQMLEQVRTSCAERFMRADCTEAVTVPLSSAAPACRQGVCHLNTPASTPTQ
jgi:hypothetical protein